MLNRISGMAASYFNVARWLVRDLVRTLQFRILLLFGLTFAVIFSKAITFGGFLLFLNSYIANKPVIIPKIGVSLTPDPMIWAPAILAAGSLMGMLSYLEARCRLQLASNYATDAMRRVLLAFSETDIERRSRQDLTHSFKARLLARGSLCMMRAAMMVMGCMLPVIQLAASAVIMLIMSWQLTAAIMMLGLLYIVPFYFINRRMMRATRRRVETGAEFRSDVHDALTAVAFPQYRQASRERAQEIMFGNDRVRELFGLFIAVRTTKDAVGFLSSVFLALFMFVIIIYVAEVDSQSAFIGFAAYAVVLLHAYASANLIARQIAAFNRFLPEVRQYAEVLSLNGAVPRMSSRLPVLRPNIEKESLLPGSLEAIMLQAGHIYGVVQQLALTYRTKEAWLGILGLARSNRLHSFLVPSRSDIPDLKLRAIVQGALSETSEEAVLPVLEIPFVADFISKLPAGLDTTWRQASESMSDDVAFALSIAAAPSMGCNAILVTAKAFSSMTPEHRATLMTALPGMLWLLDVNAEAIAETLPDEEGTYVVLATEEGILGLGNRAWAMAAIAANPGRFGKRSKKTGTDALIDDEELDEGLE